MTTLTQPRISVNKLAEYMMSKAARQRRILRQRKYPDQDFQIGMYHREAAEAVGLYLANGGISSDVIEARIQSLEQQTPATIGTQRRINSNIEALERFLGMLDDFDLGEADVTLGEHAPPKLTFHNVQVSVRPNVILRGSVKGKSVVGGIKINFAKGFTFDADAAGYVSAAIQDFCKRHIATDQETVYPQYCQVFCVGGGEVFQGVKATKARLKDIEDTCLNIADIWPNI